MPFAFRIVLLFVAVALTGFLVSFKLNIQLTPKSTYNKLYVRFQWPDVDPLLVESGLTSLFENELSSIDGIKKITSISRFEEGEITLEFITNVDLAFKKILVYQSVRRVMSQLPFEINFPKVDTQTEDNQRLLSYTIYPGSLSISTVKKILEERMISRINNLPEISTSDLSGLGSAFLEISLSPAALQAYGISVQEIENRISSQLQPIQLAVHQNHGLSIPVTLGQGLEVEKLQKLRITDRFVLGDIADIKLKTKPDEFLHRINGQEVILLNITAHEDVNRIEAANNVKRIVKEIQKELPLKIEQRYDDTEYLVNELDKTMLRSGLSIFILVLFILLFQRSWRMLVALFSSIVVSLGITFLACWLLNITMHLYTIAGITISLGLIIDNAIVMLEHYRSFNNRRIFSGILAASFTTIASLALVFYLPEESKKDLIDFAYIIIISLASSIVVAYWYTPSIYSLIKKEKLARVSRTKLKLQLKLYQAYHSLILWLTNYRKSVAFVCLLLFGFPIFLLPSKWEGHDYYNHTIGSDLYQDEIRPYIDKYLGGSSRLFYRNVFERSGVRSPDKTRLFVWATLPFGHTTEQMSQTLGKMEAFIGGKKQIPFFLTNIFSEQTGRITIEFTEEQEKNGFPYTLKNQLITQSLEWGGVQWSIVGVGKGFNNKSSDALPNFRVLLKGYEFDKLKGVAQNLSSQLLAHKRIQEVNINDHMSWGIKDIMQMNYYTQPDKINQALIASLNQAKLYSVKPTTNGTIRSGTQWIPYHFRWKRDIDYNIQAFQTQTNFGGSPLEQFGTLQSSLLTPEIHKENREYLRMLTFDYFGSRNFGEKYLDEVIENISETLPLGFSIEKKSWQWWGENKKREYGILGLAVVFIYIICVLFFENLKQPLLIVLLIPASFIGLFAIFGLGGFYFDQGGYAAFIMLAGLVVNAAIFIFSDYKNLHYRTQSKRVIKAVARKSWTILLTIISTCFGLIPFLINGDTEVFWFSLAIGVIGGLTFSILLVLVVLPVMMVDKRLASA